MEQAAAIVALASAVVAILASIWGIRERQRAAQAQDKELQRQAEHWLASFKSTIAQEEVKLKRDFMLEQHRRRLTAYGAVLKTLGAVPDVDFRSAQDFETLKGDPALLKTTANQIYEHLYGEAGLLMTMPTRNMLHWARKECVRFLEGGGEAAEGDELVRAFFSARRYLRADLELVDDRTPERVKNLVDRLNSEAKSTLPVA